MSEASERPPARPRQALASGVGWLGASGLLAQGADAVSALAVLSLLGAAEVGLATVAWSLVVMLEAFNGFGVATALVQAPRLSRAQLDAAWWYATGLGVGLMALAMLAAPAVAGAWASSELQALVVVGSLKLPLVGAALVPQQLLGRALRFRELAAVQSAATLLAAVVRTALAVSGFGAWALLLAHLAHGAATLAATLLLQPFRPASRPALAPARPLIAFGAVAAGSSALYHFYRNADYLVVGRLLGLEALGLYRVAFELAMTPAMAAATVANRAAFPVLARLQDDPVAQRALFLDAQRGLAVGLCAIAAFFTAAGGDLLSLLAAGRWQAAAPALVALSWAAVLRGVDQVFPQLFHAGDRPGLALADAAISGVVLCGGFVLAALVLGPSLGPLSVALAWLAAYPLLIAILLRLSHGVVPIEAGALARALTPAAILAPLALGAAALGARLASPLGPVAAVVAAALGVALAATPFVRRGLAATTPVAVGASR